MKKTTTAKQPWGPFVKQVLGPNVPWAWYIANLVVNMTLSTVFISVYELSARIMAGEIFDNALLFRYVGMNIASLVLSLAISYSGSWADCWTERKIQSRLLKKMIRMPMRQYDRQNPSSLISRVTGDTLQVTYALSYVFALINYIYALGLMLFQIWGMNHFIALALLCVLPYIWAVMYIPGRFIFRAKAAMQEKLANFTTFVAERLSNIKLVKSAANEDADLQLGYEAVEEYYKATRKYWLIDGATQPFSYSTEGIVGAIILIAGSILVQRGELAMEELLTMFMFSQSIYIYMLQFIFCFYQLKNAQGATAKIADIMAGPSEVLEREISFTQPDSDIALEDVSFAYEDKNVIDHVSIVIPKGKVTAIVGPSGAGKTTLLSLLERLYTPNSGEVKFGDTDAERIHLDQWRGATGYIQQSSPLLSGSIRDNIVYGLNREATDEEVFEAAKQANAYDFIMKLPQGFDTDIGQLGGKLSGGERQRIAIARMIIKDPDFLFLDEATSNLDAENEAAVHEALTGMMKGRTTVIVAHNMRTVVDADQIVVMDQGKVQATGTHETLYKSNPLYTKYFDLQFAQ